MPSHGDVRGNEYINLLILEVDVRWKVVKNFKPRALCPERSFPAQIG